MEISDPLLESRHGRWILKLCAAWYLYHLELPPSSTTLPPTGDAHEKSHHDSAPAHNDPLRSSALNLSSHAMTLLLSHLWAVPQLEQWFGIPHRMLKQILSRAIQATPRTTGNCTGTSEEVDATSTTTSSCSFPPSLQAMEGFARILSTLGRFYFDPVVHRSLRAHSPRPTMMSATPSVPEELIRSGFPSNVVPPLVLTDATQSVTAAVIGQALSQRDTWVPAISGGITEERFEGTETTSAAVLCPPPSHVEMVAAYEWCVKTLRSAQVGRIAAPPKKSIDDSREKKEMQQQQTVAVDGWILIDELLGQWNAAKAATQRRASVIPPSVSSTPWNRELFVDVSKRLDSFSRMQTVAFLDDEEDNLGEYQKEAKRQLLNGDGDDIIVDADVRHATVGGGSRRCSSPVKSVAQPERWIRATYLHSDPDCQSVVRSSQRVLHGDALRWLATTEVEFVDVGFHGNAASVVQTLTKFDGRHCPAFRPFLMLVPYRTVEGMFSPLRTRASCFSHYSSSNNHDTNLSFLSDYERASFSAVCAVNKLSEGCVLPRFSAAAIRQLVQHLPVMELSWDYRGTFESDEAKAPCGIEGGTFNHAAGHTSVFLVMLDEADTAAAVAAGVIRVGGKREGGWVVPYHIAGTSAIGRSNHAVELVPEEDAMIPLYDGVAYELVCEEGEDRDCAAAAPPPSCSSVVTCSAAVQPTSLVLRPIALEVPIRRPTRCDGEKGGHTGDDAEHSAPTQPPLFPLTEYQTRICDWLQQSSALAQAATQQTTKQPPPMKPRAVRLMIPTVDAAGNPVRNRTVGLRALRQWCEGQGLAAWHVKTKTGGAALAPLSSSVVPHAATTSAVEFACALAAATAELSCKADGPAAVVGSVDWLIVAWYPPESVVVQALTEEVLEAASPLMAQSEWLQGPGQSPAQLPVHLDTLRSALTVAIHPNRHDRLEFLGDAVVDYCAVRLLLRLDAKQPNLISPLEAAAVGPQCLDTSTLGASLTLFSRNENLGRLLPDYVVHWLVLRYNRSGTPESCKTFADTLEAIFGAVFSSSFVASGNGDTLQFPRAISLCEVLLSRWALRSSSH